MDIPRIFHTQPTSYQRLYGGPAMKQSFADYLVATGRISEERIDLIPHSQCVLHEPIARLALSHGLLTGREVDFILNRQKAERGYFGETAVQLGLMNERQLRVLLTGQAVHDCVELVEDLALFELMDMPAGLRALSEFTARDDFLPAAGSEPVKAV